MNRIEIMCSDPVVHHGDKRLVVRGRPRELFRLLALHDGKTVEKNDIAHLRDTDIDTVASKCRDLREQLEEIGCGSMLETIRGTGYRLILTDWECDARDFRRALEHVDAAIENVRERPLSAEEATKEVKRLRAILGHWKGNPASGLPVEEGFEATFDGLKRRAEDRLLMARLCTRQRIEIHEAIQELEHRVRRNVADDTVWELLLLAHDAIGRSVGSVWEQIVNHYQRGLPQKLQRLVGGINDGKNHTNPFRVVDEAMVEAAADTGKDRPAEIQDNLHSLFRLCTTLGISTASELQLEGSHLSPLACVKRTRSRLHFAGVLASKWVTDHAVRNAFERLLCRLDENNGEVRFLIINPQGEGFRRLKELRKGKISTDSVDRLRQLANAHRSLEVRVYDRLPAFRIIVIDNDVVSFSPYRLAAEAYVASEGGWQAPHVVLDPLATYPLAEAFQLLFLETWQNSTPLGEVR
jgi:DNA-binding winged helix-turn-helix (wHTH) protein